MAQDPCPIKQLIDSLPAGERERMLDRVRDLAMTPYILYLLLLNIGYEDGFEAVEDYFNRENPAASPVKALREQAEKLELDLQSLRDNAAVNQTLARFGDVERALATLTKEHRANLTEADKIAKRIDRTSLMLAGAQAMAEELHSMVGPEDEALAQAIRAAFSNVAAVCAEMD